MSEIKPYMVTGDGNALYHSTVVDALQARNATLEKTLTEIDGCFEAALIEGWIEALADGDVERIRDIYHRRIHFAREFAIRAAGYGEGV